MKILTLFVCYLLVACSSPAPAPSRPSESDASVPPAAQPAPTTTRATPARPAAQPEITITSITTDNPVIVEGRARTFENNVVVRVIDSQGQLVRETFTTSDGEMGQHNPYRASVYMTRDPGKRITVQALEYSARDGSERSLTSKSVDYGVAPVKVDLYLPERNPIDCTRVLPNPRQIPKSIAMARLLVEALIHGPSSPFPKGSAVSSVRMSGSTVTVDFNERLQNVGGSCAAQAIRAAVEKTLLQLPTVKRVVITAGGSEGLALQP
jgi:hypothetical protein